MAVSLYWNKPWWRHDVVNTFLRFMSCPIIYWQATSTSRSLKSTIDARVAVFLGIPFASPPIRSLRFMPPVASSPWKGIKTANRFAPVCPQEFPKEIKNRLGGKIISSSTYYEHLFAFVRSTALRTMSEARIRKLYKLKKTLENQSEDCLYLNVYAPESKWRRKTNYFLPVTFSQVQTWYSRYCLESCALFKNQLKH